MKKELRKKKWNTLKIPVRYAGIFITFQKVKLSSIVKQWPANEDCQLVYGGYEKTCPEFVASAYTQADAYYWFKMFGSFQAASGIVENHLKCRCWENGCQSLNFWRMWRVYSSRSYDQVFSEITGHRRQLLLLSFFVLMMMSRFIIVSYNQNQQG